MGTIIGEGITFDDVLLVPQYSEVTPNLIDLKTHLTKKIVLNIPMMSAAMDTVTESKMALTNEEILDAIASKTVLEISELIKMMEEKFGVSAAATAVVAGPAAGAAAPAAEEKTEFDVVLKSFDAAAKLKVLKLVREVCGLGLKEAKDFVEAVAAGPKTVKEGLSKEDADKMAAQFKEVGGECEIK